MNSSLRYASWLVVLPVLVAAFLNYSSIQQSLQRLLPGWTSTVDPVVVVPQGRLVGKLLDNKSYPHPVEAFLGVPYALPPVGNLRFANPVPINSSNKTVEAAEFGPRYV